MGKPFPLEPRTLTAVFENTVAELGSAPAIDFMGRSTSWDRLDALVDRTTAGLQAIGVGPGTRVGLCLPNVPFYPILFLAVIKAGAIVVNLNPLYVERELRHLIEDSGIEIVATCDLPDIQSRVSAVAEKLALRHVVICPIADELPMLKRLAYRLLRRGDIARLPDDSRHLAFNALIAGGKALRRIESDPDDVAVLQYTGGTTGLPKAAMLSHANLVANADATLEHFQSIRDGRERIFGVLPLFHVFALTTVFSFSIRTGSEMILLPRFDLDQVLKAIARTRPTYFPAVPTIYGAIAAAARTRTVDLSSIKACISGGAPLPSEVREEFERATGSRLVEGYGLSEASPIITCNPLDGVNKPGSAGIPYPGTTIEIRDPDRPDRIVDVGEIGEICARGPQVMRGYWEKPEESANAFIDGALRTGDLGYLDDEGYLFIVDRIKDLIIAGGYNVYPGVIEAALYEHPSVAEAIVIGVDDEYRGQAPKAFVTLAPGKTATSDELRDFLRDKVSKIELPREVEIRSSLPKTLIGKLSKKELVEEEKAKASVRGRSQVD